MVRPRCAVESRNYQYFQRSWLGPGIGYLPCSFFLTCLTPAGMGVHVTTGLRSARLAGF